MIPLEDTENFKRGHTGELIIAVKLMQQGWFVIPSYDYKGDDNNKAPRLSGLSACYVIPDLDTCRDGERRWVEVKTKKAASYTHITKRFEHGIPLKHYKHYWIIQQKTGTPVYLFIYEESTGDILYQSLDKLSSVVRIYDGHKMNYGGMAFFPRDAFDRFYIPESLSENIPVPVPPKRLMINEK